MTDPQSSQHSSTGVVVLSAERLFDGNGGIITDDPVVVIQGRRIVDVGRRMDVNIPADATERPFPGCTLLPGLIDGHIHLGAQNVHNFANYRTATFEVTPQLQQLYALVQAQMCFEMGFTTVRDMSWVTPHGLFTHEIVAIRDAINQGILAGPRILAGGWAVMTYAHLELLLPHHAMRAPGVTADGPWDLRKMVRTQLRDGADFIKTCASGGGGTDHQDARGVLNMTQEELDAVVDEAHLLCKTVAVHAWTPESQKRAMRAGADTLEHCVQTDDEAIAMMVERRTPLIPTLTVRTDHALDLVEKAGASPFVMENYRRVQKFCFENLKRLHQAGVRIVCGTDLNIQPEMGNNALELEMYVELGMTPVEALLTATGNAADALGLSDLGVLASGKLADVVAVAGNPMDDIKVLRQRANVNMVMKEGRVYLDRSAGRNERVVHDVDWAWPRLGGERAGGCCGVDR
jgi:imidazolonepropionase-like amidohydrolase